MAIAIAVWSLELAPGQRETVVPVADIKITNVALGDRVVDSTGRSTVKLIYNPYIHDDDEDEESPDEQTTVLCSLTAGKFEHTTTDIILEKETPFTFTVGGKNTVYLSGNYIDQDPLGHPPFDESDIMSDDEGDLDDLASDEGMESEEMTDASRFEEMDEEQVTNLKRGREPDATGDSYDVGKKSKKLKADNGQAISADTGKGAAGAKQEKKDKKDKKDEKKSEKKKDERNVEKDEKTGEKKEKRKAEKKDESKPEKDGKKKEKLKPLSEKILQGGLKAEDFKIGDGPAAKKGNTVSMRYIGKLENGNIFDKNVARKPFTFRLGQGEVIKGWDEGIVGMQVNGERKLTIPPSLGYGKKGTEGIPPNSTLIFEVKLVEIK